MALIMSRSSTFFARPSFILLIIGFSAMPLFFAEIAALRNFLTL